MPEGGRGLGRWGRRITRVIQSARAAPRASARATASARDVAPSLRYTSRIWVLTVFSEMYSCVADLAARETGREAPQHRQLGRTGLLHQVTVSGIRSSRDEVLLDGGGDRR